MSCFINSFCQPFATCLAISLLFNRITLLHTSARDTVQLLTCESPDFIALALWPANIPDLNPVDYHIWGSCSVCSRIHDVDHQKSRLIEEWEHFQVFIDKAISGVHVFELVHGGHFKHQI